MKYTIQRTFGLRNKRFKIIANGKILCHVKARASNDGYDRFNVKSSEDDSFLVELNSDHRRSYLIYLNTPRILFGELSYRICGRNNYLYRIVIGEKIYRVRSSDLLDRYLTIIDTLSRQHSCSQVLFQTNDAFSQFHREFHLTINDIKSQYGYLALVILLILHEQKR